MKSEVVEWLCDQPELDIVMRQKLFDWCRNTGAIVFVDGRWQGREWSDETRDHSENEQGLSAASTTSFD